MRSGEPHAEPVKTFPPTNLTVPKPAPLLTLSHSIAGGRDVRGIDWVECCDCKSATLPPQPLPPNCCCCRTRSVSHPSCTASTPGSGRVGEVGRTDRGGAACGDAGSGDPACADVVCANTTGVGDSAGTACGETAVVGDTACVGTAVGEAAGAGDTACVGTACGETVGAGETACVGTAVGETAGAGETACVGTA